MRTTLADFNELSVEERAKKLEEFGVWQLSMCSGVHYQVLRDEVWA